MAFPAAAIILALVVVNGLCTWFLSRRSFREFAVQFVVQRQKEKQSELMQKVSEKKIRRGIWS